MSARHVAVVLALAALILGGVSGCGGSKVSKSNFDRVRNGMTQAEVESILGKGLEEGGASGAPGGLIISGKVVTWTDGDKSITVTFGNGKVVAKMQKGL